VSFLPDEINAEAVPEIGRRTVSNRLSLRESAEDGGSAPEDENGLLRRLCQTIAESAPRSLVFAMEPVADGRLVVRAAAGFGAPWFSGHPLCWRQPGQDAPRETPPGDNPLARCVADAVPAHIGGEDLERLPEGWDAVFAFLEAPGMLVCPVRWGGERHLLLGIIALFRRDFGRDESHPLRFVAGMAENVMALGKAHASLERENSHLRLVARAFANALEGVIITDAQQRILAVNQTVQRVTGYSEDELIGRTPKLLASGRHAPEYYRNMWEEMQRTGQWKGEIWNRRKNGEVYPELLSISTIEDERNAVSHYVGIFIDISQQKEVERQLHHLAYHDPLTGLPNREQFRRWLDEALDEGGRHAVLLLDIDRLKNVNDSFGHVEGDALLASVAARFAHCLRDDDVVARLGGDEFVMLLRDVRTHEDAVTVAHKIVAALAEPLELPQLMLYATASIGIALYPENGGDSSTLLRHADAAMYSVKRRGGNGFEFYRPELSAQTRRRLEMETDLRRAVETGELRLHYQPLVEMESGRVTGVEALVRWEKDGELVAPGEFIPLAEETGLIIPVGDWVLREACRQCQQWREHGFPAMNVAVNLSVRQLRNEALVERIAAVLAETNLSPDALELEITESVAADSADGGVAVMSALRELGVRLAIDDFGTGFSCLSYLKRFPVGKLKIDRSFVSGMLEDANDAAIVGAIVAMAGSMGMRVLAEGIETAEQLARLKQLGCDDGQGFYFGRPAPAENLDLAELRVLPGRLNGHRRFV
jgi:diguanylate cyclase (GGDEF)-like protein/PAS domain S-box-containing protein